MNLKGVMDVAVLSDTGLVRGHNEDSTGADLEHGLLLVADGMGGYRAGEVASAIAITATVRSYRSGLKGLTGVFAADSDQAACSTEGRVFRDAIENANTLIYETARDEPEYKGMGTTVVGLVFHDEAVTVGHVGDSRAYRYRDGELTQLMSDHTVRQELVDRGLYTAQEANEAISRNLVTRALGVERAVEVDIVEESTRPGDLYLLCSDGLNDMVGEAPLQELFARHNTDIETLASELIKAANANGGEDNVSILLARLNRLPTGGSSWGSKLFGWLRPGE